MFGFIGNTFKFVGNVVTAPFKVIGGAFNGALDWAPDFTKFGAIFGGLAGAFNAHQRTQEGEDANIVSSFVGGALTGAAAGGAIGVVGGAVVNGTREAAESTVEVFGSADTLASGQTVSPPSSPNANRGVAPRGIQG